MPAVWTKPRRPSARCKHKKELEQENGNDSGAWRAAFRAGGAVMTDELKQRHMERVARRELAQECDNMNEVLAFELDRLKEPVTARPEHTVRHIRRPQSVCRA
jgi:hypothetical protein